MALQDIKIDIVADDNASQKIKGVDSALGGLTKSIGAAAAAYITLDKATEFVKGAYKEAQEYADAQAKLARAIGKNSEMLLKQADALSRVSMYEDDQIVAMQAQLGMYVKNEAALKALTPAVLDLAAANGIDLKTAAQQVGRAIADGGDELGRYKIALEGAAGSGDRVKSAIEGINAAAGGQAAAAREAAGGVADLQMAWANFLGDVGAKMKPAIDEAARQIQQAFLPTDTDKLVDEWNKLNKRFKESSYWADKAAGENRKQWYADQAAEAKKRMDEIRAQLDDLKPEEAKGRRFKGRGARERELSEEEKKAAEEALEKARERYRENQKLAAEGQAIYDRAVQAELKAKQVEEEKWMTAKSAKIAEYNLNGQLAKQKEENAERNIQLLEEEAKKRDEIEKARQQQIAMERRRTDMYVGMAGMTVNAIGQVAQAAGANAEEMKGIAIASAIIDGAAAMVSATRLAFSSSSTYYEAIAAAAVMDALIAAGTAAQVATISQQSFAQGGIVQGNTAGDTVGIRANGGEVMLNRDQQTRLLAIADGRGASSGGLTINAGVTINGNADARTVVGIRTAQRKAQEDLRRTLIELKNAGRMPALA